MSLISWRCITSCMVHSMLVTVILIMAVPVHAQQLSPDDDFDVILIPVGQTTNAPNRNLSDGKTLLDRGFQALEVVDENTKKKFPLGQYELGQDELTIRLGAGEAIQLLSEWSSAIPVSATSVYFSAIVSSSGEQLQQAALAVLDGDSPNQQSISISLGQDIPSDKREFSLEYQRKSNKVFLLIQVVGPQQGESVIVFERMRFLDGYRELDLSLGATAVTETEHFGYGIDSVILNKPPSTTGGSISIGQDHNHVKYPSSNDWSLKLKTDGVDDVVQAMVPLKVKSGVLLQSESAQRFYGLASLKRISGDNGIFTIAMVNFGSGNAALASVGYGNYTLDSIPSDAWLQAQSTSQFKGTNPAMIMMIIQLQGGPAEIVIDDVSIHAKQDSIYFWDASAVPGLIDNQ
jgi:hypothetical protein